MSPLVKKCRRPSPPAPSHPRQNVTTGGTSPSPVNGVQTGILVLKLGETSLPVDLYEVAVYLFDAQNDDGVFWDSLEVMVRDWDA